MGRSRFMPKLYSAAQIIALNRDHNGKKANKNLLKTWHKY